MINWSTGWFRSAALFWRKGNANANMFKTISWTTFSDIFASIHYLKREQTKNQIKRFQQIESFRSWKYQFEALSPLPKSQMCGPPLPKSSPPPYSHWTADWTCSLPLPLQIARPSWFPYGGWSEAQTKARSHAEWRGALRTCTAP